MTVSIVRAEIKDAECIHEMQIKSFMPLLQKYQDFETSPANEPLEKIITRINQLFTVYYLIKKDELSVGAVRIVKKDNEFYRVSPIFILPEHQGKGIAQEVFRILEKKYHQAKRWELNTILQEQGNCYLYEKIGYKKSEKQKFINDKMTLVRYEKIMCRAT